MEMSWKEIRMKKIDYLGGGGKRTYWPSYCPVNVREIMRSSRMEERTKRNEGDIKQVYWFFLSSGGE